MLVTLLSTLGGALINILPSFIAYLNKRLELEFRKKELELEIERIRIQAQYQSTIAAAEAELEAARAVSSEGTSLRSHDSYFSDSGAINTLRASVRPVITYTFFLLFVALKTFAFVGAAANGANILEALNIVWDVETQAIFGAIMGFWFGSRTIEKLSGVARDV